MYSPLFVTLMGIGTVFFGLICIIALTSLMGSALKSKARPVPAAAVPATAPTAPAASAVKEQEVLAAVIAAVTEDLGPSASRMQITAINKI